MTPGPWDVVPSRVGEGLCILAGSKWVARLTEVNAADALLMAAAPELASVLYGLLTNASVRARVGEAALAPAQALIERLHL